MNVYNRYLKILHAKTKFVRTLTCPLHFIILTKFPCFLKGLDFFHQLRIVHKQIHEQLDAIIMIWRTTCERQYSGATAACHWYSWLSLQSRILLFCQCSGILIFGRDMWGLDFLGGWTARSCLTCSFISITVTVYTNNKFVVKILKL